MNFERLGFFKWLLFYPIILLLAFEYFISSDLINHVSYNIFILFIFYCQSVLPIVWLPIQSRRPSVLIKWVFYLAVIVPSIIIPYVSIEYSEIEFFIFNCFVLLSFYVICWFEKVELFNFSILRISKFLFYVLFFSLYLLFLFRAIQTFGFNITLVSLRDVYDVRSEYKDQLMDASFAGTQIRWLLFIFNPFLIIMGYLDKKKLWMLVIGVLGELFIYSISGLKSALFINFALFAILFFLSKMKDKRNIPSLILKLVIVLLIIILSVDLIFFSDSILYHNAISSLTIRRNFILTGHLSGQYFAFFDSNPKNFMANNSLLGYLVDFRSPYGGQSPPDIIGAHVFGQYNEQGQYANANVLADGFAQYGYIGMIIVSFMMAVFLHVYDSLAKYAGFELSIVLLVPFAFTFSNSAFFTVLVGHGAVIALFLLTIYVASMKKNSKQNYHEIT